MTQDSEARRFRATLLGPRAEIQAVTDELRVQLGPRATITVSAQPSDFLARRPYGHVEPLQVVVEVLIAVGAPLVTEALKKAATRHPEVTVELENSKPDGPSDTTE